MVAFGAGRHMPAERLGSAGFNRGHDFQLAETDMPGIGPPPRGTISSENISDLQLGTRQLPVRLHQPSPERLIL